jgi:four helix bundle protein
VIKKFTDLTVWQEAHKLAILTYRLTDKFPKKELFVLISQMRRAAVSITSNIAEGFSRYGKKEKTQFYTMAKGSLTELENQFLLARDVGYLTERDSRFINKQIDRVGRLLTGIIKSTRA